MINIDDKTRIKTDKYNFILERLEDTNNKDGSVSRDWKVKGYYTRIDNVIQAILNLEVKDNTYNDLKELYGFLKRSHDELKRKFGDISPMSLSHE